MKMNNYKRFHEETWLEFGKTLLKVKNSDEQVYFLESCKSGKDRFLGYMENYLLTTSNYLDGIIGEIICPLDFNRSELREQEFINPEQFPENEQVIWDAFKDTGDAVSCNGFWGYVTLNMIKKNYIQPAYLERSGDGVKAIDHALQDKINDDIDTAVRSILRSMCNQAARGKRVIFNECYLSKSYWRWQWADKMSSHIQLSSEEIREILNATYYAIFAEKMHSGKNNIDSENVLGGLLLYLKNNQDKVNSTLLGKIIDQISNLNSYKDMEKQNSAVNHKAIQQIADKLSKY